MLAKSAIVDALGERTLLLPQLLQAALAANDRIKFCFTLLQAAESHALHPDRPIPDLSGERRAARIVLPEFDRTVADSQQGPGGVMAPGASHLRKLILDDVTAMHAPLALAGTDQADALARRRDALAADLPEFTGDRIAAGVIRAVTSADRTRGDSLHILVMDLHKALNALQGEIAEESLDGARIWRVTEDDRPVVRGFMAGLNETAPLKFDHPGLGTTATRSGEQLIIQNDIGTTDAHVLVVHVDGLAATLTYTDVHAQRAAFFQSLFNPFAVRWDDTCTRHGEQLDGRANYYLCIGYFAAADQAGLVRYLAFLGSRIVFLIDWNRARKRLREFVQKGSDAVRLLKWAADHNIGHRGFLKLGGERLIYDAVEFAQHPPLRYGERLDEALGRDGSIDYLRFVLRATTEGLLHGHSERLIRDEVRVELARRFHGAQEGLIALACAHAALVFDLATGVLDSLMRFAEPGGAALVQRTAERATRWEQAADTLVSRVRSLARRTAKPEAFLAIVQEADDAADGLEDAAFLATLLADLKPAADLLEPMSRLAALLLGGARELVKMMEAASHVHRDGAREDLQDVLEAVDRMVAIEHETDATERAVTRVILRSAPDFRTLNLLSDLARALEEAADALSRCALKLRDHLLHDVVAG